MWRGAVESSIRGKRGQAFLKRLAAALDEMPVKELVAEALVSSEGVCAMGCAGKAMGIDLTDIDPEDSDRVAKELGIADALAREISYINDEQAPEEPDLRFAYVRKWVDRQIKKEAK